MISWIPLLVIGMIANAATVFVLFAPPAHTVFNNHPECLFPVSFPDLNKQQKAFCREWKNHGQK